MKPKTKRIIIDVVLWIVTPVAIYGTYKGVKFVGRRVKEKNLLEALSLELIKKHASTSRELTENDKKIVEDWKIELRKLDSKPFYAFADYALATNLGGKDEKTGKWLYEISEPEEFAEVKEKFVKRGGEIGETKLVSYLNSI